MQAEMGTTGFVISEKYLTEKRLISARGMMKKNIAMPGV
jgi:hypothetical protein